MGQLEEMQSFIRVVDAGSISRAAEQIGIAKSAVSRRLVDLETRMGAKLLNRTTRTSSLTDKGQRFYEHSLKIIDDIAELQNLTHDNQQQLKGTIHIAAPLSFGFAVADKFMQQHPAVKINVNLSDRQVNLIEEGVDIAIRIANLKDSSLISRKLAPIKMLLCASPTYLKDSPPLQTVDDLKQHQLLHYSLSSSKSWKLTDSQGMEHLVNFKPRITANNGDFLSKMAIAGHGIVMLPSFIVWKSLAAGELVEVLDAYRASELTAYVVYPQSRYLSHRTRVLIDFLVQEFGENPYWDVSD